MPPLTYAPSSLAPAPALASSPSWGARPLFSVQAEAGPMIADALAEVLARFGVGAQLSTIALLEGGRATVALVTAPPGVQELDAKAIGAALKAHERREREIAELPAWLQQHDNALIESTVRQVLPQIEQQLRAHYEVQVASLQGQLQGQLQGLREQLRTRPLLEQAAAPTMNVQLVVPPEAIKIELTQGATRKEGRMVHNADGSWSFAAETKAKDAPADPLEALLRGT